MKYVTDNEFYCCKCGVRGIPILRKSGQAREAGHLKKLWCLNCKEEVNFCEINPFSTVYTYKDFLLEFKYHNFDERQNRIKPYGIFKNELVKQGVDINAIEEN